MLDWFTGLVGYDASNLRLGRLYEVTADGEFLWEKERSVKAVGSYKASVQVRRNSSTPAMVKAAERYGLLVAPLVLEISGNPVKYLQGHNAYGPSVSLLGGIIKAFVRELPKDLRPGDAESELYPALHRSRIDTTTMIDLGRHQDVHEWLRAAATTTRSRHGRPIVSGTTVYWGQHSTRWSIKAYCKFCELEAHPCADLRFNEILREYVEPQLRIELTLRRPELKDKGTLFEAEIWDYFSRIVSGGLEMDRLKEKRPDLKPSIEACLKLWLGGDDVRMTYNRRTFYRYRLAILKETGIDISLDRNEQEGLIEKVKLDMDWLKEHEIKAIPSFLQARLFKPGACPVMGAH